MRKTMKILAIGCIGLVTQACSGMYSGNYDLVMMGSEEGFNSLSDWQVGTINETKASPDVKSSYWQSREKKSDVEVFKFKALQGGKK